MSLIRTSYRALLKKCKKLSYHYPNPDDLYFTVFGVLARSSDFSASGYGDTPFRVIRSCFDRPSQPGDEGDTEGSRIVTCFAMIRRLNEIQEEAERRQGHLEQLPQRGKIKFTSQMDHEGSAIIHAIKEIAPYGKCDLSSSFLPDEQEESPTGEVHNSNVSHSSSTECKQGTSSASADSRASPLSWAKTKSVQANQSEMAIDGPRSSFATTLPPKLLDEIVLCRGSFLIEQKGQRRLQKVYRHAVVSNDSKRFPPYSLLLAPEPMYTRSIRHSFAFPLLIDVVHCLGAALERNIQKAIHSFSLPPPSSSSLASFPSSTLLSTTRISFVRDVDESEMNDEEDEMVEDEEDEETILRMLRDEEEVEKVDEEKEGSTKVEFQKNVRERETVPRIPSPLLSEFSSHASSLSSPTSSRVDRTVLSSLMIIPTTSLTLTDFVEVEVFTRFITVSSENVTQHFGKLPHESRNIAKEHHESSVKNSESSSSNAASETSKENRSGTTCPTSGSGIRTVVNGKSVIPSISPVHVFAYSFIIRNRSDAFHPTKWNLCLLSQHLVVMDVSSHPRTVSEICTPGIGGNFPTVPPGESHFYEGGTILKGAEGLLQGTIQVNAYNKSGKTRAFDLRISPTRLSVKDSFYDYSPLLPEWGGKGARIVNRTVDPLGKMKKIPEEGSPGLKN